MKMKKRHKPDPTRPVTFWKSTDLLDGEVAESLTIILRTRGCRWNRCTMCGFAAEGAPATGEQLVDQFKVATRDLGPHDRVVKIYTSGSFFDPLEVPAEARRAILDDLASRNIEKVILESRPEYITSDVVLDCASRVRVEVATGLETSNDLIREHLIRKGFTFQDFKTVSEIVHKCGCTMKTYLLLKPPHLSEGVAISDMLQSAKDAAPYSDVLSLNLCNVQKGTYLERMWQRGDYRPPWLWSAIEVLKNVTSIPIICDPVAAGSKRGPHNCGSCDGDIAKAIRKHATTQDQNVFEDLDCGCKAAWEKVVELEDLAFGAPLF